MIKDGPFQPSLFNKIMQIAYCNLYVANNYAAASVLMHAGRL